MNCRYKGLKLGQYYKNSYKYRFLKVSSRGYTDSTSFEQEIILKRPSELKFAKKLPNRLPFLKHCFHGSFDKEVLQYPDIFLKDRFDEYRNKLKDVQDFVYEKVDSSAIDSECLIPASILDKLKLYGLYGMEIPNEEGGLGFSATETAHMTEVLGIEPSIASLIRVHHSLVSKAILLNGTNVQKEKYLSSLANGAKLGALCLKESMEATDSSLIETIAYPLDENSYVLNGRKDWIINGGGADTFIVLGYLQLSKTDSSDKKLTAFIIERNIGDISSQIHYKNMGQCGLNTSEVIFKDVIVPKANVLGEIGKGNRIIDSVISSSRLSIASSSVGLLRFLILQIVKYISSHKYYGYKLSDYASIKRSITHMVTDLYAMESMTYLTAGLVDKYENYDCSVESAACKVFCSEKLFHHCSVCIEILGALGYKKQSLFEKSLRDSTAYLICDETNTALRSFISLSGLKEAGIFFKDKVKYLRNPTFYPAYYFKHLLFNRNMSNPKLDLRLFEELHLTLEQDVNNLEKSVKYLSSYVGALFEDEGRDAAHPKSHAHLNRLADISIDIYALTAMLGRASKAYCNGHYNADNEVNMCWYYAQSMEKRIKDNIESVMTYPGRYNDEIMNEISNNVIERRGFIAEHPTHRFFW